MPTTDSNRFDPAQIAELTRRARAWAAADPDPVSQAELVALIEARAHAELYERMLGDLEFGTAGLRGVVGAGSARMNLAVVIRVTRALVDQLLRADEARRRPVVIGGDARPDSARFADAAARVLIAAGIPVKRFPQPVPTPLVAYAVRALGANAGIVITASHNPAAYNGYKLYLANGVQVIPPLDREIATGMQALGAAKDIPLGDLAEQDQIQSTISDRYRAAVRGELPRVVAERKLRLVYTPLHGVGAELLEQLFSEAGYADLLSVPEQREPDGRFPTVAFPNPEEPGALDLAISLANAEHADLLLANDPDADRLAVAIPTPAGGWLPLTGNQIGLLLADFALTHGATRGVQRVVLSSLVSSPMLESVAAAHGAHCERVLTGFKWVWTAALALEARGYRYAFGYEEALGYSFGRAVRDKDGISAALAFVELAAEARASQHSVLDRLHALYREHGLWVSVQHNVVLEGGAGGVRILRAMQQALDLPPSELGGRAVSAVRDLRVPEADAPPWRGPTLLVEMRFAGGRVVVRPSGTEPKLKIYVDLLGDLSEHESINECEERALISAHSVARALIRALGLDVA